jgi:superkiller protein 3
MKTKNLLLLLLAFAAFLPVSFSQPSSSKDVQPLMEQGLQLMKDKKSREAIEKFKQVLAINPNHTDALYELGWCYNDLKEYTRAMENLRKARQVWTEVAKVHYELGYAFEKQNYYDSAIKCYNKCLEISPTYSLAFKQLGNIAYYKENYEEALRHYRKYEDNNKGGEITDYLYWYRKGFVYNSTKDYLNAKIPLERSVKYKDDYINTWLELGFSASKQKKDEEAIGYYTKAMALDPKSHVPYNGIAEVYRDNKKDMDRAMEWYNRTLAINPNERKANFSMGYCLNSKQKYRDAIPYLKKAIEYDPAYTAAYVELGYSYYKTGMNADAITQFEKALNLSPKNENARYYSCLLYIDQKNKAKAQQMVDELKALSSKFVASLQPRVSSL